MQVIAMHYADHKERVTVDIGGMLQPENVTPIAPAECAPPSPEANDAKYPVKIRA